jgi:hypothetical protein
MSIDIQTKTCTKCKETKPISEFHKQRSKPSGYRSHCKSCRYDYQQKNKDHKRIYDMNYRTNNRDRLCKIKQEYFQNNKDYFYNYIKTRLETNINYKLSFTIRSRIRSAIKNQYGEKAYKSPELLGCTIEEARLHIESQFKDGMTWENHGLYGWHIDHIRPCASFDLSDPEQQKQCFHYTNLQPLWADENLQKGDKWEDSTNQ